jgi:hypothetical protein
MKEEILAMSSKELDRASVIKFVLDKKITQLEAAKKLSLSERQVRRLCRAYQSLGAQGLISKKRARTSNRKYPAALRTNCLDIIQKDYYDYGPTLAAEKLWEYNNCKISKETARKWMIEAEMWHAKKSQEAVVHQPRMRRPYYGELIQIDGSVHDWFEERGPRCTLLVFIDDATSFVQKLLFVEAETTFGYLRALKDYLGKYGKPRAFYSDKHVVFKVNIPEAKSGNGFTQFGRVLNTLDIKSIFAHSPQAKGRVERCNGTLQDRLVKALRYNNISNIADANIFLEKQFVMEFNKKFAKIFPNIIDIHRKLSQEEQKKLDTLFTIQTPRKVSKNLLVRHKNCIYKLMLPGKGYRLRQAGVLVCEDESGKIAILYKNQPLNYEVYKEFMHEGDILSRKELDTALEYMRLNSSEMAYKLVECVSLTLKRA